MGEYMQIGEELVEIANRKTLERLKMQEKMKTRKTALVISSVVAGAFLACFLPSCFAHFRETCIAAGCFVSVAVIIAAIEEVCK